MTIALCLPRKNMDRISCLRANWIRENAALATAKASLRQRGQQPFLAPPRASAAPGTAKEEAWLRAREQVYGLGPPQADHHCTLCDCVLSSSIEVVDAERSLYGCLRSGHLHECRGTTEGCTETHSHSDGSITCTFSGTVVDHAIDERNPELYGPGKRDYDSSTFVQQPAALDDALSVTGIKRALPGAGVDRSVPRPKRARNLRSNAAGIRRDVHTVVSDLLFDSGERKLIDRARADDMEKRAVAIVRKMCKNSARARTRPMLHEADATYSHQMTRRARLLPLKFDSARLDYYCTALCRLWMLVAETPECVDNA
ncbi:hypothetical protein LCGC14_1924550, partial [marine sediment metagenome]